jgi:hypothetical protein
MNEQEIRDNIKLGVKSPSFEFTDKVVGEIFSLQNDVQHSNKRILRILLFTCCLLITLSIFVRLPEIEFYKCSIGFSPVIMPIISLIFLFIVLQQLHDLKNSILDTRKNNVVQHTI